MVDINIRGGAELVTINGQKQIAPCSIGLANNSWRIEEVDTENREEKCYCSKVPGGCVVEGGFVRPRTWRLVNRS